MRGKLSTRAEAIKALGLPSARALDKLLERGAPAPKPGKKGSRRYDVAAIEAWRAERKTRTQPVLDLSAERARLARVQRKLTTLKLRELRGALVRVKDAERVQVAIAGAVKTQLLAVPRRCVLDGLPREYEALVHKHITQALRELSEIRTLADLLPTSGEDVA